MHKRPAPARWFAIHVIAIKRSVPALRSRCFSWTRLRSRRESTPQRRKAKGRSDRAVGWKERCASGSAGDLTIRVRLICTIGYARGPFQHG
jgi:hypothetical protein